MTKYGMTIGQTFLVVQVRHIDVLTFQNNCCFALIYNILLHLAVIMPAFTSQLDCSLLYIVGSSLHTCAILPKISSL